MQQINVRVNTEEVPWEVRFIFGQSLGRSFVFLPNSLNKSTTQMTMFLPFDGDGVTEMLGTLEENEEGPMESSEVWDFPAPLVTLDDCGGPAGLWMDGERAEREKESQKFNVFISNLSAALISTLQSLVLIHERERKGHLGKGTLSTEHMLHHGGLYSVLTPFGAHMHVAEEERLKALTTNDGRAIWRSSRYRLPVGGMAGEMDERLDQRMDGWTGHRGKKIPHTVNA